MAIISPVFGSMTTAAAPVALYFLSSTVCLGVVPGAGDFDARLEGGSTSVWTSLVDGEPHVEARAGLLTRYILI